MNTSGLLLIAVGLVALYVVFSDKYPCFVDFVGCLTNNANIDASGITSASQSDAVSFADVNAQTVPYASPFNLGSLGL